MSKPLSLVLIEQLFSFMEPLGFTTYQIELDEIQFTLLTTLLINEPADSPYHLPIMDAGMNGIQIGKDGMTLTFVEKK